MAIDSYIIGTTPDQSSQLRHAHVTHNGALVTAPLKYSDTVFRELDVVGTAYNFFHPLPRQQFVITAIYAFADKQVSGTTNATVEVYEAAAEDSTTVVKTLLKFEMGQQTQVTLLPLNLLVNQGVYLNAKTDDDDIHMTIMGYYLVEEDPSGSQAE